MQPKLVRVIHTSFMWAGSSLRGPFHEQPREAPGHLNKRRLTFVRRVTLASRWESGLEGAEQVPTGQELKFCEQDEQMTSPSEQIYEMGQLGHFGTLNIEDWCTYGDAFLQTGQDSESAGGCKKRFQSNMSTPDRLRCSYRYS